MSFFFFFFEKPQTKEMPWSVQSSLCRPCGLLNKNTNWEHKEETITESSRKRLDIQLIVQAIGDRVAWWEIRKESILQEKEIREIKERVLKKKKTEGTRKLKAHGDREQGQMKWRGGRRWDKNQNMDHTTNKAPPSHYHRAGRDGAPQEPQYPAFLKHKLCAGQTDRALCFYSQSHTVERSSHCNPAVGF